MIALTQIMNMSRKYAIAGSSALIAAAAVVALGSCSSDDEIIKSNYPSDNIVRIDAGVNAMTTRASVGTNTLEGPISVSIYNDNPVNGDKYSYVNYSVTKSTAADGTTTWTPESQMLWQSATQPVTVIAYAPHKALGENDEKIWNNTSFPVTVPTEQTATDYSADFLVYKKIVNPGSDLTPENAIPISFSHALSQLNITVKFGTELDQAAEGGKLTSNPIEANSLKVSGTRVSGECDFTAETPEVMPNTSKTTDVLPYESAPFKEAQGLSASQETTNATQVYSCILIPQEISAGDFKISFTMNGKEYRWTATDDVILEAGNNYTLTITVGKDFVVMGGMNAKPWQDADPSEYKQNIETD